MPTTLDDVYETRRENLTRLLREPGAKTQLAARLGASQSHITHLLKPPTAASARAIREETARQIEEIMGLAMGQLDRPSLNFDQAKIDADKGRVLLVHEGQRKPFVKSAEQWQQEQRLAPVSRTDARNFYDPAEMQQLAAVHKADPALLEDAFRLVLEAIIERGEQIPAEKAAKMARVVYEQALATGKVDTALVGSLINLMT
jgi:hypothetical protein